MNLPIEIIMESGVQKPKHVVLLDTSIPQVTKQDEWAPLSVHIRDCNEMNKVKDSPDAPAPATSKSARHSSVGWDALSEMQKEGVLCDVVLASRYAGETETRIFAHRNVLAAHSSFFRATFTVEMVEAQRGEVHVDMRGRVLQTVVNFCYTGEVTVDEDVAIDLLIAADMCGLEKLTDLVCSWLLSSIRPSNVMHVWLAAARTRRPALVRKCASFAYNILTMQSPSEGARCSLDQQLLDCPLDHIRTMLSATSSSDTPSVQTSTVAVEWMKVDPGTRESHANDLSAKEVDVFDTNVLDATAISSMLKATPTIRAMSGCVETMLRVLSPEEGKKAVAAMRDMREHRIHIALVLLLDLKYLFRRNVLSVLDRLILLEGVGGRIADEIMAERLVGRLSALILLASGEACLPAVNLIFRLIINPEVAGRYLVHRQNELFGNKYVLDYLKRAMLTEDPKSLVAVLRVVRGVPTRLSFMNDVAARLIALLSHSNRYVRKWACSVLALVTRTNRLLEHSEALSAVLCRVMTDQNETDETTLADAYSIIVNVTRKDVFARDLQSGGAFSAMTATMQRVCASARSPSTSDLELLIKCCKVVAALYAPHNEEVESEVDEHWQQEHTMAALAQLLGEKVFFECAASLLTKEWMWLNPDVAEAVCNAISIWGEVDWDLNIRSKRKGYDNSFMLLLDQEGAIASLVHGLRQAFKENQRDIFKDVSAMFLNMTDENCSTKEPKKAIKRFFEQLKAADAVPLFEEIGKARCEPDYCDDVLRQMKEMEEEEQRYLDEMEDEEDEEDEEFGYWRYH